jgi:choline-sulfatase
VRRGRPLRRGRTRTYDNAGVLASDVPTWAHHLRAAGYEVVAAGKMHFVGADQLHGLERRLTPDIYPADFSWTPDEYDYDSPDEATFGKALQARQAGPCDESDQLAYDQNVHARSLEFLRARRPGGERPFCLLVSYSHPHPPYLAPRRFWDMYEGQQIPLPLLADIPAGTRSRMERWLHGFEGFSPAEAADQELLRRLHRAYYAMVSYVDARLGELLAALAAGGLDDRTAVIFASDHGDMLGQRRQIQKRCFFEPSARVPLIGSFPGRWAEGAAAAAPVSLLDLVPTLTDLAGVRPPTEVDGVSLLETLRSGRPTRAGRTVFSEYEGEWVPAPCFMARRGALKYIYAHGADRQLYDLETDPLERHNLIGGDGRRGVAAELHAAVTETFDVDAIARDMVRSRAQRLLMHRAMQQGSPTRWDYRP